MTPEVSPPVDIRKYLDALWKRKWAFLLFFIGVPTVTMIFTFTVKPIYEAKCVLLVRTQSSNPLGLGPYTNPVKNQIFILNTFNFAKKVWEKIKNDEKSKKDLISYLQDGNPVLNIKSKISYKYGEKENLLFIKVKGHDREQTVRLANIVAEVFIETSEEIAKASAQEVVKFLEKQIPKVEESLKKIQDSLKKFKKKEKLTDIKSVGEYLSNKIRLLDEMLAKTEVDIKEKEGILKAWEQRRKDLVNKVMKGEGGVSNIIEKLYAKIVQLETQKTSLLLEGFEEDSKEVKDMEAKIEQVKKELIQKLQEGALSGESISEPFEEISEVMKKIVTAGAELKALQAKKEAILKNRENVMKEFSKFPDKEIKYLTLQREFKLNEEILMMLKKRYEEAKLQEVGRVSNFVIVEPAFPPKFPVFPKKRQNLLFSIVIGLGLALSIVFLLEYLDTTVRDADELKFMYPDIPLLAAIPFIKVHNSHRVLVTQHKKSSLYMESFRTLRSNLKFSKVGEEIKAILVTSAQPDEGKTTITVNLALTFQMTNLKTLVIEGDLRKPRLPDIFGEKEKGLTDYLLGTIKENEIIYDTFIENVYYIPPGEIPPNPTELLSLPRFNELIKKLKEKFDVIIIDSPPVTLFVDAVVISNNVDGTIILVQFEYTKRETLEYTVESLKKSGSRIIGFVANKIVPSFFRTRTAYYYPSYKNYKKYGYSFDI